MAIDLERLQNGNAWSSWEGKYSIPATKKEDIIEKLCPLMSMKRRLLWMNLAGGTDTDGTV